MAENLESLFPRHDCELILSHNTHKNNYQTIEQWEKDLKACSNEDDADPVKFGWVSVEQRDKAIAKNSVWELHWYPDTPIGFFRIFACDLDVLLAESMREDLKK